MRVLSIVSMLYVSFFYTISVSAQNQLRKFYSIGNVALLDSNLVFAANDQSSGNELWISDGTPAGTRLLKDIHPGMYGSEPVNLTYLNGKVFFSAYSVQYGNELWMTDGTPTGTQLLKDIVPDEGSSYPFLLRKASNFLYFVAKDDGYYDDIWISDGTTDGSKKIIDLNYSQVHDAIVLNDKLYFTQPNGTNNFIWITDKEGLTYQIGVDDYYYIDSLRVFNNKLFFITYTSYYQDVRFWTLDPANSDELIMLKEIHSPAYGEQEVGNFMQLGENMYFSIRTYYDYENQKDVLWKTDGTVESTDSIYTFSWNQHYSGDQTRNFLTYKGKLYFNYQSNFNTEIWESDGTTNGTRQFIAGSFRDAVHNHTVLQDKLLYAGNSPNNSGYELYITDGTVEGTKLFLDLKPSGSSNPDNLTPVQDHIFFSANNEEGLALWTSDACPVIRVQLEGTILRPDGDYHFSTYQINQVTKRRCTISNSGLKELFISNISLTGGDYFIKASIPQTIFPGQSMSFYINHMPVSLGESSGVLQIHSNDFNSPLFTQYFNAQITQESTGTFTDSSFNPIHEPYETTDTNRLKISNSFLRENSPSGAYFAKISVPDMPLDTFTYFFTNGIGSTNNEHFVIINDSLITSESFDYELENTLTIRLKAISNKEDTLENYFIISVADEYEPDTSIECGRSIVNLNYPFNDVAFQSENTAYAVGGSYILRSDDAGSTWQKIRAFPSLGGLKRIQMVDEQNGYILCANNYILKTVDGGNDWFPISFSTEGYPYNTAIHFLNPDTGFILNGNKLLSTKDGGISWVSGNLGSDNLVAIDFTADGHGIVCGPHYTIYLSDDYGATWRSKDISAQGYIRYYDVDYIDDVCYLMNYNSQILKSEDYGETWVTISQEPPSGCTGIRFINNDVGYAYGSTLYKTIDGGRNWNYIVLTITCSNSRLAFNTDFSKAILAGGSSFYESIGKSVFVSDIPTDNWQNVNYLDGDLNYWKISFKDDNLYVIGSDESSNTYLFESSDLGMKWNSIYYFSEGYVEDFQILESGVAIANIGGTIYKSNNHFNYWETSDYWDTDSFSYDRVVQQFLFIDSTTGFYTNNMKIFKTESVGSTWDMVLNKDGGYWFTDITFSTDSIGYAVGYSIAFKTIDRGNTWIQLDDFTEYNRSVYFYNENLGFIGTNDGVLYKTEDGGQNWQRIVINSYMAFNDIFFENELHGYIIASDYYLLETIDGGLTWDYTTHDYAGFNNIDVDPHGDLYFPGDDGYIMKFELGGAPGTAGMIIGPENVCVGTTIDYTVAEMSNEGYLWSYSDGTNMTANDNRAAIYFPSAGNYLLTVTPYNNCGTGTPRQISINAAQFEPFVTLLGPDTVISFQENVPYRINPASGYTSTWNITGGELSEYLNDSVKVHWFGEGAGKVKTIITEPVSSCREMLKQDVVINPGGVFYLTLSNNTIARSAVMGDTVGYFHTNLPRATPFLTTGEGADNNTNFFCSNKYLIVYSLENTEIFDSLSIRIMASSGYGVITENFKIYLTSDTVESVITPEILSGLMIYPNPVLQELYVMLPDHFTEDMQYSIMDIVGNTFLSNHFVATEDNRSLTIQLSNMNPGVYILAVRSKENVASVKFIKK